MVAILILLWALFSPWGAIRSYQLSKDLTQLEASKLELQDNNRQLKEEIDLLSNDPDYIEDIARKRHNLLKSNEIIYVFSNKNKSKQ